MLSMTSKKDTKWHKNRVIGKRMRHNYLQKFMNV